MKKSKKLFKYKNKIILTNGASLTITSIKYIQNYQLNFKITKEKKIKKNLKLEKKKLKFFKQIFI